MIKCKAEMTHSFPKTLNLLKAWQSKNNHLRKSKTTNPKKEFPTLKRNRKRAKLRMHNLTVLTKMIKTHQINLFKFKCGLLI